VGGNSLCSLYRHIVHDCLGLWAKNSVRARRSLCLPAAIDAPRLLHRRSEHGYTSDPTRALGDAGEAVPVEAQAELTARVHRSERQAQLDEWARRKAAIQREIDWLTSQRFRRDVRSDLRALQRQVDRLDARLH
jgi:hypothetical protein